MENKTKRQKTPLNQPSSGATSKVANKEVSQIDSSSGNQNKIWGLMKRKTEDHKSNTSVGNLGIKKQRRKPITKDSSTTSRLTNLEASNSGFRCATCNAVFVSRSGLLSHSRSIKKNPKCAENYRKNILKNKIMNSKNDISGSKESSNKVNPAAWSPKNSGEEGGRLGLFAGLKVPVNEIVHCRYRNGKISKFPDHYPASVLKNNEDGTIDVIFLDGKIIQRRVCRNDVKELRVPLQLFNLRAGDLRLQDRLSATYIYQGQPVKGWEHPSRKVVATLVEVLDISDADNILISYAHTGKNKHQEYIDIHSIEFAPRLLEENFIDK